MGCYSVKQAFSPIESVTRIRQSSIRKMPIKYGLVSYDSPAVELTTLDFLHNRTGIVCVFELRESKRFKNFLVYAVFPF